MENNLPSNSSLKSIVANGASLAYHESGQGEPLVLVHGHISDYRTWDALQTKLSTKYHVYSYSRRFAWPNEPIKDDEPQPWEQDSTDLEAFIQALNIAPVHALGNSSGATTILLLARSKPNLFRTLLLEEPPLITLFLPSLPPPLSSVFSFLAQHPISFWSVMIYGATTIGPAIQYAKEGKHDLSVSTFTSGCLGPKFWPRAQADPERRKVTADNSKWLYNHFRYNNLPSFTVADARKFTLPALILTGADGPYFAQCIDAELLRVYGAEMKREVKIPDAGHLMHEDNPAKVYDAVIGFLAEHNAK